MELIQQFFEKAGIPGIIVQEPFKNFGYNRSFALKACESISQGADYLLLLDADMVLQMAPDMIKQVFCSRLKCAHSHMLFQGTEAFLYKNVRIVRNRANISYIGVTHEYVNIPSGYIMNTIDKSTAFILDIGDGGSKQDKFLRDIRLLTQGLVDEPENTVRYTFYLANTYRDAGQLDLAIETYKKRIVLGSWFEEVWQSHYNIANIYYAKGHHANAIYHWLEAYQVHPQRVENLYHIIQHYRLQEKYQLAYHFYHIAKRALIELSKKQTTPDYLFVKKDIYDYKVDYEMSILGYYFNQDGYDLARISMDVLAYPYLDESTLKNVCSNYKFYAKELGKYAIQGSHFVRHLYEVDAAADLNESFVSSSPSIVRLSDRRFALCKRFVNYRIDDRGGYVNQEKIETRNRLTVFKISDDQVSCEIETQSLIQHNISLDHHYVGIEDVRLFSRDGSTLEYSGNRGMPDGSMQIEMGEIDLLHGCAAKNSVYPRIPNQGRIEKNWVHFWDPVKQKKKTVYGWYPLLIGDIVQEGSADAIFSKTHENLSPRFFQHLRGSSHGQIIGNEIWFLCHLVSYEDRRYYYHLMLVLDLDTYQIKGYTPLFTFEKKAVEYTLGCFYNELSKTFFIGYSLMDRESKYMEIAKSWFDDCLLSLVKN
jgi:tetratricopeptide (TPR) repeat protein